MYWILSESSLPEGPLSALDEARSLGVSLSEAFREPVTVYLGEAITRWTALEVLTPETV